MNDDKKSIVVILGMVFLSMLIILPPLFRLLFPKITVENKKENLDKLEILTCDRTISNSDYSTHVEVIYQNNEIEQNQITYTKIDEATKATANTGTITPEEESSYLSKLNNIDVKSDENTYVITLNKKSLEDNPNDQNLINYIQPLSEQEKFYSELGYSCSTSTK